MVNCVDYYDSGVYRNKANSPAIQSKNGVTVQNNQVSFGKAKPKEKVDEFVSKDKEFLSTCTDGQDDGKISFKEGAKAFLGGVTNHYLGFIEEAKDYVKENPVKTAAITVGAIALGTMAIATFGVPVVFSALSILGITLGVKGIYNSVKGAINNIKNAKNAQTDAEKKQALYGLGGNSAEFVDSSLEIYGGVKGLRAGVNAISQIDDYANMTDDIPKNVEDLLKKAETGSLTQEEKDILKEFYDKKDEIWDALKNSKNSKMSIANGILGKFTKTEK